jgi:hypothetical protein
MILVPENYRRAVKDVPDRLGARRKCLYYHLSQRRFELPMSICSVQSACGLDFIIYEGMFAL